jgi:hypothetical protein
MEKRKHVETSPPPQVPKREEYPPTPAVFVRVANKGDAGYGTWKRIRKMGDKGNDGGKRVRQLNAEMLSAQR